MQVQDRRSWPPEAKGETMRVLLLGGTGEALALAEILAGTPGLEVRSSLAGRTVAHRLPPGTVRVGGFGGVAGLIDYLRAEGIGRVVDATHPFAARISRHAAAACAAVGIPRLQLRRPGWERQAGDRWIEVADMAAAAAALPELGNRVFLAVGRQELAAFAGVPGVAFVARMVEAPEPLSLPGCSVILARGPFAEADEIRLFRDQAIGVVVSKDSGGGATYPKLAAARALGLPVVLIRRPPPEAGPVVESVAAALAWIRAAQG
ncbi:Precorrin-6A reductase [Azospirillaceae bacterium]